MPPPRSRARATASLIIVASLSGLSACAAGGPGATPEVMDGQTVSYCALAPVPIAQVRRAMKDFTHEERGLTEQGVLVESWGIQGGRLVVTLDRRTKPGSVEIVKSATGPAGLCVIEGGEQPVAN